MITKILFTLGVIVACIWFFSARQPEDSKLRVIEDPAQVKRRKRLQQGAFAMMGVLVLVAAAMIFVETSREPEVVTVHVINTQNGERRSYRAVKNDIESDRFTTPDGRVVFLAGVERLEVDTSR